MLKTTLILLFTILLNITFISPSIADNKGYGTGHDLLRSCTSTYDTDYGYCAGFVTGIADVMLVGAVDGHRACNHAPVRSQQFIDITTMYMEHNKDIMNDSARSIVASALERSFPCFD